MLITIRINIFIGFVNDFEKSKQLLISNCVFYWTFFFCCCPPTQRQPQQQKKKTLDNSASEKKNLNVSPIKWMI